MDGADMQGSYPAFSGPSNPRPLQGAYDLRPGLGVSVGRPRRHQAHAVGDARRSLAQLRASAPGGAQTAIASSISSLTSARHPLQRRAREQVQLRLERPPAARFEHQR